MHGGCGMWGLLATGLLGEVTSIQYYYGPSAIAGGFYRRGQMLACQIVGILAIGGWTAFMMASCFSALKAAGRLRVNAAEEAVGMDESYHGGSAYPEFDLSYHDGADLAPAAGAAEQKRAKAVLSINTEVFTTSSV